MRHMSAFRALDRDPAEVQVRIEFPQGMRQERGRLPELRQGDTYTQRLI